MARYFFTGGIMPSDDLLLYFQRDVQLARPLAGVGPPLPAHERGWLANMDAQPRRDHADPGADLWRGSGHASGGCTGACSSCPARSCGDFARGANGSSRITCSRSVRIDARCRGVRSLSDPLRWSRPGRAAQAAAASRMRIGSSSIKNFRTLFDARHYPEALPVAEKLGGADGRAVRRQRTGRSPIRSPISAPCTTG